MPQTVAEGAPALKSQHIGYYVQIGSCHTPEILGDVETALACIEAFAQEPRADGVALLLFTEGVLQGYLVEPDHLSRYALDLTATSLQNILRRLAPIRPTLVFGVTDRRTLIGSATQSGGRLANGWRSRESPGPFSGTSIESSISRLMRPGATI
jgi:hypothetical protein